jgi:hypothetical protein
MSCLQTKRGLVNGSHGTWLFAWNPTITLRVVSFSVSDDFATFSPTQLSVVMEYR